MEASLFKHARTTLERIEKFISKNDFTDVNLYGRLYLAKQKVERIEHWFDESGSSTCQSVRKLPISSWKEVEIGFRISPVWSLHWFRVSLKTPTNWPLEDVRFLWQSGCEAQVYTIDGVALQGVNKTKNKDSVCLPSVSETGRLTLLIQATCSDVCGCGLRGLIQPPDPDHVVTLAKCELALENPHVRKLLIDFQLLVGIAQELGVRDAESGPSCERGQEALHTANSMLNLVLDHTLDQYKIASRIADDFFSTCGSSQRHTVHAVGHCHIDTAWLWDYSETRRKCIRSWSGTAQLLDKFKEMRFACSQAQQFDWLRQDQPELFLRLQQLAQNGSFLPTGSTWVEMDANIPSGESFVRQFLYGQRFFEKHFGKRCKEFWLPDTFGYSAQTPQIMRHFGVTRFVTQKMSWNLVNTFPHNTFYWQGLDGTQVLAHFPPGDCYTMEVRVSEVCKTLRNFKDKGRSKHSLFLYGHGDGGQGPTENMLLRLGRMKDVEGLPRVQHTSVDEFFEAVEAEEQVHRKLCTWKGELYLELHNGTYTTQREVKRCNVECERLLQTAEWLLVLAAVHVGGAWADHRHVLRLEELWKNVLLNQFHDVLPGSSIERVYKDAHRIYAKVRVDARAVIEATLEALMNRTTATNKSNSEESASIVFNASNWPLNICCMNNRRQEILVAPSYGITSETVSNKFEKVIVQEIENGNFILENRFYRAVVDRLGRVTSFVLKSLQRELVSPGAAFGQFCLYDDVPLFWDAWDVMDYHLETRRPVEKLPHYQLESPLLMDKSVSGDYSVRLVCRQRISSVSTVQQTLECCAHLPYLLFQTQVDWHESHKLLRVEFPVDLHGAETHVCRHSTQYGHLLRSTLSNDSWQSAQFEVCSHGWMDLSEHGTGVSLIKHAVFGGSSKDGRMSLTLLRSPKAPDAHADMGVHRLLYGVLGHQGDPLHAGVVRHAAQFLSQVEPSFCSLQTHADALPMSPLVWCDSDRVVLDSIKPACDVAATRRIVLRMYESFGGRCCATVKLHASLQAVEISLCSGMEECLDDADGLEIIQNGLEFKLQFSAFQIRSVLITCKK